MLRLYGGDNTPAPCVDTCYGAVLKFGKGALSLYPITMQTLTVSCLSHF